MKKLPLIVILLFTFSCDFELTFNEVNAFTADDLRHLYYDKDTILNAKDTIIDYYDTIQFLYNSKDTIDGFVNTYIFSSPGWAPHLDGSEDMTGRSIINLGNNDFIKVFSIEANTDPYDSVADKYFSVGFEDYPLNSFSKWLRDSDKYNFPLISIKVLGIEYTQVYKFGQINNDSLLRYDSIYFAKDFGYIKIFNNEGNQLELISRPGRGKF